MRWTYVWITFVLLLFLSPSSHAQIGPKDGAGLPATDLERVKIGDKAPDFTLENADGKKITLSSYRGKKDVVLVFYRGYW
jgi:cytochrome oxidase Cu insertion factor (SCO1/SenC/PrrC family)